MNAGPESVAPKLILASTSVYRRELLARLRLPFETVRPQVDETPAPGEVPQALAQRLASAKAEAIAAQHADAWVIGSDQVAELDTTPLGKGGDRNGAIAQLMAMSGHEVRFLTAVTLSRRNHASLYALDITVVRFRALSIAEIERYVDRERTYDCAGSFKAEGLGITLFDAIESQDPTALIGLPLIATARLLRAAGFALP
ncbi:MAG: Maf family nucleotide pyrophosphatase [Luteimonas sp.]